MKKKYITPDLEILEALFTEDVLYASTGEDNVDDVGGNLPGGDTDIPTFDDFTGSNGSPETPDNEIGGDWGVWW